MAWQPPIRCTGRRYANGPVEARLGCLERPAPYYFGVKPGQITFEFPPGTPMLPMHWIGTIPTTAGINYQNQWHWHSEAPGTTPPAANVWTWFNFVTWSFNIHLRIAKFGDPPPNFVTDYRMVFPNGFPKWPEFYDLQLTQDGGYPGGAPDTMRLYIVGYDQMPAGSCITGGV